MVFNNNSDNLQDVPFVVSYGSTLVFDGVGKDCISIVGLTSSPKGYPISGAYGEECINLTIVSKGGKEYCATLKNGVHITTLHTTLSSSRIRPIAEKSYTYAYFSYDKNFENYVINRLDLSLPKDFGEVEKVVLRLLNNGYNVLIYGVFA
ncbi:MAG: hypothetical protein J6C23_07110 [Clostridia bacterium]|nr:hypothetical protein [Clostridia bacterium]